MENKGVLPEKGFFNPCFLTYLELLYLRDLNVHDEYS